MRKHTIAIVVLAVIVSASVTVYAKVNNNEVVNALQKLPYLYDFIKDFFIVDGTFSVVTFKLVKILLEFIIGIIILSVGKNFVCQGAVAIYKDTKKIVTQGLIAFLLVSIILVLFLSSLIGFPFGILVLILEYVVVLIGKVCLNIYIGNLAENKLKQKWHIYLNYLIGTVIVESFCFIPYLDVLSSICITPIITIGIIIVTISNRFIYKIYYAVPFNQQILEKKYDRESIKKIVLNGIEKEGKTYEKES